MMCDVDGKENFVAVAVAIDMLQQHMRGKKQALRRQIVFRVDPEGCQGIGFDKREDVDASESSRYRSSTFAMEIGDGELAPFWCQGQPLGHPVSAGFPMYRYVLLRLDIIRTPKLIHTRLWQ
jgi:hypothetical protein